MKTALKTPIINSPISKGFSSVPADRRQDLLTTCTDICQDLLHLAAARTAFRLQAVTAILQSYKLPQPTALSALLPLLGAACCTAQPITDIQHGQNLSFCSFSLLSSRHRRITTVNQHTAQAALLQSDTGRVHQPFCGQRQPQHSRY